MIYILQQQQQQQKYGHRFWCMRMSGYACINDMLTNRKRHETTTMEIVRKCYLIEHLSGKWHICVLYTEEKKLPLKPHWKCTRIHIFTYCCVLLPLVFAGLVVLLLLGFFFFLFICDETPSIRCFSLVEFIKGPAIANCLICFGKMQKRNKWTKHFGARTDCI